MLLKSSSVHHIDTQSSSSRHFLGKFRLPGEAQVIDRFMVQFASRYCSQNPTVFKHEVTDSEKTEPKRAHRELTLTDRTLHTFWLSLSLC